jgi:hypothetical protein
MLSYCECVFVYILLFCMSFISTKKKLSNQWANDYQHKFHVYHRLSTSLSNLAILQRLEWRSIQAWRILKLWSYHFLLLACKVQISTCMLFTARLLPINFFGEEFEFGPVPVGYLINYQFWWHYTNTLHFSSHQGEVK